MNNECLIDFDPYPSGYPVWYDDGDTVYNGFNSPETFADVYCRAEDMRIEDRKNFLRLAMCHRLLTCEEEIEALAWGLTLTSSKDWKLLSDLWFNQRRLQMLARGVNIQ